MKRALRFHPEVREEVDSAFAWYEAKREGLGGEFLAAIGEVLDRIRSSPELHPVFVRDVRVGQTDRFPYGVFFRVEDGGIYVVAVQHGRRNPRRWRTRL